MAHAGRLDVVEAIWNLQHDTEPWLQGMARALDAALPASVAATAFVGSLLDQRFAVDAAASVVPRDTLRGIVHAIESAPAHRIAQVVRVSPDGLLAFRTGIVGRGRQHPEFQEALAREGATDTLTIGSVEPDGTCALLTAAEPAMAQLGAGERRAWLRVASHLSAAARLRRAARTHLLSSFDVLLEPSGRISDAAPGIEPTGTVRDLLQRATASSEASRRLGALGRDDAALALRQALWDGKWSVVDVWDTDGRRFYAAVQNPPDGADLRALSPRERQIVDAATTDLPLKVIASDLELSESSVSRHLTIALRKLGLPTRTDLMRAAAASRLLVRLESAHPDGGAAQHPHAPAMQLLSSDAQGAWMQRLTPAEQRVAALLVEGVDDATLAARLRVSRRTIANQCAAIFHKLGVGSRVQLTALAIRDANGR